MAQAERRRPPEAESSSRSKLWLLMTIGGLVPAVAIVAIVAVLVGVMDRSDGEVAGSSNALAAGTFAQLADGGYVLGNPDAPVTLLEFGDFQ